MRSWKLALLVRSYGKLHRNGFASSQVLHPLGFLKNLALQSSDYKSLSSSISEIWEKS